MPDSLSDRYAELLTGSYDCVDRIVSIARSMKWLPPPPAAWVNEVFGAIIRMPVHRTLASKLLANS
jgi:hypothetical protein